MLALLRMRLCRLARASQRIFVGCAAVALLAAGLAGCGGSSHTSPLPALHPHQIGPDSMFTLGGDYTEDPVGTMNTLQQLGVQIVHLYMNWSSVAPDAASFRRPRFDARDPDAYAAGAWAPYDALIRGLTARHIAVNLSLTGTPPYWAEGAGDPKRTTQSEWKPNVVDYERWVEAVGRRYSGHFTPPKQRTPLPRISFWSGWNEPNLGINLAPETTHPGSAVEVAPRIYRQLTDAYWTALHQTGHGHDRILIGEIAPVGDTTGLFSVMVPLRFLRALYCVGADLKPLQGTQARLRGCPTTAAASERFLAENPALFKASGFALHPYSFTSLPPDVRVPGESQDAELAALPSVESLIDHLQRVYGSDTRYPLWSTEYGYITNPPNDQFTVTPALAAYYLNWADYITWENPRLRSYDQYLLADAPVKLAFATGLETASGQAKATLAAYRMPLFLPVSSTQKGHALVVWGQVRPAPVARRHTHHTQIVAIEFHASGASSFHVLSSVTITNPNGFFEVRRTFPSSGTIRLRWAYPNDTVVYSRTVKVTLH
jgi:hypothetical protein